MDSFLVGTIIHLKQRYYTGGHYSILPVCAKPIVEFLVKSDALVRNPSTHDYHPFNIFDYTLNIKTSGAKLLHSLLKPYSSSHEENYYRPDSEHQHQVLELLYIQYNQRNFTIGDLMSVLLLTFRDLSSPFIDPYKVNTIVTKRHASTSDETIHVFNVMKTMSVCNLTIWNQLMTVFRLIVSEQNRSYHELATYLFSYVMWDKTKDTHRDGKIQNNRFLANCRDSLSKILSTHDTIQPAMEGHIRIKQLRHQTIHNPQTLLKRLQDGISILRDMQHLDRSSSLPFYTQKAQQELIHEDIIPQLYTVVSFNLYMVGFRSFWSNILLLVNQPNSSNNVLQESVSQIEEMSQEHTPAQKFELLTQNLIQRGELYQQMKDHLLTEVNLTNWYWQSALVRSHRELILNEIQELETLARASIQSS